MRRTMAMILIPVMLSACATDGLREVTSNSRGPDEFIVPKAELATALGGRPPDPNAPIPGSDGALVTAASRLGVTPNIRTQLAQEDADFRARQSRFTGFQLFPEDLYNKVYRSQTLDARDTADARTPSYPPPQ